MSLKPSSAYRALYDAQAGSCFYCLAAMSYAAMTRDHVVPRVRGGKRGFANIVLACGPCNNRKGDRDANAYLHTRHGISYRERLAYFGLIRPALEEFEQPKPPPRVAACRRCWKRRIVRDWLCGECRREERAA